MIVVALVLAVLAGLVHVYIFFLESLRWTAPRTRAIFGVSEQDAQITAPLAYNQGFYNLFLAIAAVAGVVLVATGHRVAGSTSLVIALGSMTAAALVLALSDRSKLRAAAMQGTLPLLGLLALLIA